MYKKYLAFVFIGVFIGIFTIIPMAFLTVKQVPGMLGFPFARLVNYQKKKLLKLKKLILQLLVIVQVETAWMQGSCQRLQAKILFL